MNKYETVFLISNKITKEQKNAVITKVTDFIAKNGKITKTEDLGERKLAYEVKKHDKAVYYIIEFESNSETITELERIYRITEEIIKFITIRKDD